MWNRRGWLRWGASACLSACLPAASAQTVSSNPQVKAGPPRVVIVVEDKAAFCYLPLTIAERLGYFAAAGLDVEVRELADAEQCVQAIVSGAAHVYSGPYSNTLRWQSRGVMLQSLVVQGRAPQMVMGVSQKTMGHFQQLGDLRGKRVGVKGLGTGSHRMARLLLGQAGLSGVDVQFISMPDHTQATSAFRTAQLDAICYGDPVITALQLGADLRVVADTRTVQGTSKAFGGPMPGACLMTQEGFIRNHPRHAQSLADAMVHALKWLQTAGPSDLIKTIPERYFEGDRALYLEAFSRAREAWAPDGLMPEGGPGTAARMLTRLDPGPEILRVDLAGTFTNEFARKAKAKFRA